MVLLLPDPLSRQQVVSLSQSSFVSPVELSDGRGGGRGGGGAKLYEGRESVKGVDTFNK